ncbi:microcystin-dependent protein [Nonlabens dokdonensis]|jgi:microcystin-dependent protein|uniref:Phenylacrylic acid decarboxylase n=2 Tax=Nonlabens dokdonensis TaxID=328515 RepID=L7W739_NONDD|nr:tail fiber protein [Nonlabens dokdonensis]AGC76012.1 phenylacrylic acid decarboxylase [Nonlabens dokdonensis DSW-6]PZX36279.1 microcystin-dependent protein [Nonlabens dokdonensis]
MDPFLGEITTFAGNFAPRGWAFCHGQLLAISQNSALFSILGTTYGGDGRTTFALPDLRGRAAVSQGNGPGLSSYNLGQRGGLESVTLNETQIPSHTHTASGTAKASSGTGTSNDPAGANFASASTPLNPTTTVDTQVYTSGANDGTMAANNVDVTVGNSGSSQSHTNMQPFLAINYIIALQGVFPSRN